MGICHQPFRTSQRSACLPLDPDEPAGDYVEEIIEGTRFVQARRGAYDENELKPNEAPKSYRH